MRGTTALGNTIFTKPDQGSSFLQGLLYVEVYNIIAKVLCFS